MLKNLSKNIEPPNNIFKFDPFLDQIAVNKAAFALHRPSKIDQKSLKNH